MIVYIPLIVCIAGLLIYALMSAEDGKVKMAKVGIVAFACGLLVTLLVVGGKVIGKL